MRKWNGSAAPTLNMAGGADSDLGSAGSIIDEIRRRGPIGGGSTPDVRTGIRGLMLAVLEDGIRAYLGTRARARSEAEFWVNSKRQNWPFAFIAVCSTLGLEPSAVRRALHSMRERSLQPRRAIGRSRPNVRRVGQLRTNGRARQG